MNKKYQDIQQPDFIPTTGEQMRKLGWDSIDVLLITGDAYIDHPAFGVALLGRWLIAHGFKVGIIAQPRWQDANDFKVMGKPNLFVGITAGALDSQLAHYTAFRKKRHDDAYTPGGQAGARPNRASLIYSNLAKQAFGNIPIVLGGIEASLRRISHYDFWSDSLRRSILLDAKAQLIVYGMGERAILQIAEHCAENKPLNHINGTVFMAKAEEIQEFENKACITLPSHEDILQDKTLLMDASIKLERHVHVADHYALQMNGSRALVIAPPASPLSQAELDNLYTLPFQRKAHPQYTSPIPAEEMLRTSITSHRGCGGACSFCSIALHQGRRISSRSETSIMQEVQDMSKTKRFSGSISDVGGPTANMWQAQCTFEGTCKRVSCCHPTVCKFFHTPQKKHVALLRKIRDLNNIKHVRVASGIRADIALRDAEAVTAYTIEFTGGQLKVAPEHCNNNVLKSMRKPPLAIFERFLEDFMRQSSAKHKEQYVIPYLMSAFPSCTNEDMQELAQWLKARNWKPQQVQCFIPTPGTIATAMYYAEVDENNNPIYVAKSDAERLHQHRILVPTMGQFPRTIKNNNAKSEGARYEDKKQGQKRGSKKTQNYQSQKSTKKSPNC